MRHNPSSSSKVTVCSYGAKEKFSYGLVSSVAHSRELKCRKDKITPWWGLAFALSTAFRIHKHKREMECFYQWNLKFGNICYSTKHNQEGLASSECCKRPAGTPAGRGLTLPLGANRAALALPGRRSQVCSTWLLRLRLKLWPGKAWLRWKYIYPFG